MNEIRGTLRIVLLGSDIRKVAVPVLVAGRYLNLPAYGTLAAFDELTNGWISQAIERGIICSLLGELAFVPLRSDKSPLELLIIGGMGELGTFNTIELRYLMSNIALAVNSLGHNVFATTLIGAGTASISPSRSVRAIVDGCLEAFQDFTNKNIWQELTLVVCVNEEIAYKEARCELERIMNNQEQNKVSNNVHLEFCFESPPVPKDQEKTNSNINFDQPQNVNRVMISLADRFIEEDISKWPNLVEIKYAALAKGAVVPQRLQYVQKCFLNTLPESLRLAKQELEQQQLGKTLERYVVPEDLFPFIHGSDGLVIILDKIMAGMPWELACFQRFKSSCFYGLFDQMNLTRQFCTVDTVAPGVPPSLNKNLKILLIADPAPDELSLPDARNEALAVLGVLDNLMRTGSKFLESIEATVRIGSCKNPELLDECESFEKTLGPDKSNNEKFYSHCDPIEILGLLLSGKYDVVHFAGHGMFEEETNRVGWVFGHDCLLTATEILKSKKIPRLVIANACYSGKIGSIRKDTSDSKTVRNLRKHKFEGKHVIGMAEAFFQKGIQNFLCTGWQVKDRLAKEFATRFYQEVLGLNYEEKPISMARAAARARLSISNQNNNNTWGAYQFYGDPSGMLLDTRDNQNT